MKLYGYAKNTENLLELSEVTVQSTPTMLRKLAAFFTECADNIEANTEWEHEHFNDVLAEHDALGVDIVVFKGE